jgi:hypothetical protein
MHGALAVTFLFLLAWFLQVGPDQFEKASAAGSGTGNPFEGGFGNPFEDIFGGGGGGGGMNSVCCPHIILIFIAYHLFVLCLLVCFLLACSTSALQCNCKKGIHWDPWILFHFCTLRGRTLIKAQNLCFCGRLVLYALF